MSLAGLFRKPSRFSGVHAVIFTTSWNSYEKQSFPIALAFFVGTAAVVLAE